MQKEHDLAQNDSDKTTIPKRIAIFPGSFDPFTIGHESILKRGLDIVDEIIIAIGVNDSKHTYFTLEERMNMLDSLFQNEPRIRIESYNTLTVEFAKSVGAKFILRGIRTVSDFEFEMSIADANRKISGIETLVLFTEPEYASVSSTIVRELLKYNYDVSEFIPKGLQI